MYKYAMHLNAIPLLANSVANIIKSLYGRNKKALILDLDNTLWGGIIGDDGVEGIVLGPELPEGQVYSEFQSYCKNLKQMGVLLAVNSKNEEENALLGLKHTDSILSPDDFACIKANWLPKDRNLQQIAAELNLGTDSFVFADDNPAEREIVSLHLPEVATPCMGSAEHYIKVIDREAFFETTIFSNEDLKKAEMYQANAKRAQLLTSFSNYDEYLDSLQMSASIQPFNPVSFARISQLTNKSNQFNLTTKRCTEADIQSMAFSENHITLMGKLNDKFGDNGIVSLVAGEIQNDALHIQLWLMSCRVLKRGLEDAMMNTLVELCKERNLKNIIGYYFPTSKNGMVRQFYEAYGFVKKESNDQGDIWILDIANYVSKVLHMKII